ncbi:MAG: iron-sulfur cluster assembly scaffold protein [Desulfobacteraceae bacterium]|nr:iron-sulfur cluster assembly scaffold protein [Desulfobacteraceae bacterium]
MNTKNDKSFDFWNDHSLEFLEMAMKRDFQESIISCDGYGKKIRSCGDTIEFYLMIKDNVIQSISYDIKGCLFSHACANTVIKFARMKPIEKAKEIIKEDIIAYLKTLPAAEEHCAVHSLAAFHCAIDDYEKKQG